MNEKQNKNQHTHTELALALYLALKKNTAWRDKLFGATGDNDFMINSFGEYVRELKRGNRNYLPGAVPTFGNKKQNESFRRFLLHRRNEYDPESAQYQTYSPLLSKVNIVIHRDVQMENEQIMTFARLFSALEIGEDPGRQNPVALYKRALLDGRDAYLDLLGQSETAENQAARAALDQKEEEFLQNVLRDTQLPFEISENHPAGVSGENVTQNPSDIIAGQTSAGEVEIEMEQQRKKAEENKSEFDLQINEEEKITEKTQPKLPPARDEDQSVAPEQAPAAPAIPVEGALPEAFDSPLLGDLGADEALPESDQPQLNPEDKVFLNLPEKDEEEKLLIPTESSVIPTFVRPPRGRTRVQRQPDTNLRRRVTGSVNFPSVHVGLPSVTPGEAVLRGQAIAQAEQEATDRAENREQFMEGTMQKQGELTTAGAATVTQRYANKKKSAFRKMAPWGAWGGLTGFFYWLMPGGEEAANAATHIGTSASHLYHCADATFTPIIKMILTTLC